LFDYSRFMSSIIPLKIVSAAFLDTYNSFCCDDIIRPPSAHPACIDLNNKS
jgi:hypothetical protein